MSCLRSDFLLAPHKAGIEASTEVAEAAASLYQRLSKAYWWDGRKKRKINHDVTKLQYACDLTTEERNLVKDLHFISGIFAGTQQVRLHIGHALFGARVELGDPLFITISPNSRLSGLCVRLSRYCNKDPLVVHGGAAEDSVSPWSLKCSWECMRSLSVPVNLCSLPVRAPCTPPQ